MKVKYIDKNEFDGETEIVKEAVENFDDVSSLCMSVCKRDNGSFCVNFNLEFASAPTTFRLLKDDQTALGLISSGLEKAEKILNLEPGILSGWDIKDLSELARKGECIYQNYGYRFSFGFAGSAGIKNYYHASLDLAPVRVKEVKAAKDFEFWGDAVETVSKLTEEEFSKIIQGFEENSDAGISGYEFNEFFSFDFDAIAEIIGREI